MFGDVWNKIGGQILICQAMEKNAKVLQSAERFDPMTGSWEELRDGTRQS